MSTKLAPLCLAAFSITITLAITIALRSPVLVVAMAAFALVVRGGDVGKACGLMLAVFATLGLLLLTPIRSAIFALAAVGIWAAAPPAATDVRPASVVR